MDGAASRSPPSRRQLFSLSEPPQSGVARNTACHRTPKWLARRPDALRPGCSFFPSPNLLKAVSRGIPLATALQNGWRGVPKPFVPAAALFPLRTSSKRCRAEYRLPPHSKMAGAASRCPPSRRQRLGVRWQAVFRATPLFQASPRMQTPRNGVESQNRKKCLNM